MDAYLSSLHFTTVSGIDFVPSLPHLFMIFVFLFCTGLMFFVGVLLKWANPCMYFGIFCAFLSMRNILPIFSGEAMWIPLLMVPGCLGGCLLYLLITFIMWLMDIDKGDMSDTAKLILATMTVVSAAILLGVFLYVFVTHSLLIIILACASLGVLGMLNQRKIIANAHRFKTYNDLYDIQIDEYAMKLQKDADHVFGDAGVLEEKKEKREKKKAEENKRHGLMGMLLGGKKRGGKDA
ncbi:MAG: hypothetical protein IJT77_15330 [Clostridia bacterium]|nr:hypothetical protein [Clostridia bacterium]